MEFVSLKQIQRSPTINGEAKLGNEDGKLKMEIHLIDYCIQKKPVSLYDANKKIGSHICVTCMKTQ